MNTITRILAILVAAALIAAGVFVYTDKPLAPKVDFTTLKGERIENDALRGKVVLINFWATTCATCIAELPMLIETHNKFTERGLETVAVAMKYDPEDQVRAFVEKTPLPFKVAVDDATVPDTQNDPINGPIAQSFGGVRLTPTTFLIDRRGRIVHKYLGAPDFAALHTLLEELLAESA